MLHKTVAQIEQMSTSEYLNWIRYFEDKNAEQERLTEVSKGNLMAMSEEQVIEKLTGGS